MFTMNILNIEQIAWDRARIYRSRGPWERDYAKQVIGTQYLFTDTGYVQGAFKPIGLGNNLYLIT